jgi:hypothetical protein
LAYDGIEEDIRKAESIADLYPGKDFWEWKIPWYCTGMAGGVVIVSSHRW